jgi:predicted RNase H-like nuclease (RuvC/YqgF family)
MEEDEEKAKAEAEAKAKADAEAKAAADKAAADKSSQTVESLQAQITKLQSDLGERDKKLIEANAEAAKYRKRNDDEIKKVLEALGIEDKGGKVDPAQVQAEVESLKNKVHSMELEKLVTLVARGENADSELMYAYLLSQGSLNGVDVTAQETPDKLKEKVQKALEAKPALKASQQAPRSSGPDGLDLNRKTTPDEPKRSKDFFRKHFESKGQNA